MSRKRKLEDSEEGENENNQIGSAGGDPQVVRYKIKRTRVDEGPQNVASVTEEANSHGSSHSAQALSERDASRDQEKEDLSHAGTTAPDSVTVDGSGKLQADSSGKMEKISTDRVPVDEGVGEAAIATSKSPVESDLIQSSETTKESVLGESLPVESITSESDTRRRSDESTKEIHQSVTTRGETPEQPGETSRDEKSLSKESSPQVPLFDPETLTSRANIQRTPFSSRRPEEDSEAQSTTKAQPSLSDTFNAGVTVEKLEAFPQFSETSESPEKVSSPSGSRPQSFPGEEKEECMFTDFNAILLKCVNTSSQEEKPVFKYRQAGTGVVRILEERDTKSRRVVFRQSGTWQVYLNSPLDLVGRVESVDQSTYFAVKFTALDAIASTNEKPILAPFCVKLPDTISRNKLVSLLRRAE